MGFPVFCRGFCILGTAKAVLGPINHPTLFGGVVVNPGDLILGDDDGMVVVARKDCEAVLEKSIQADRKRRRRRPSSLKAGDLQCRNQ